MLFDVFIADAFRAGQTAPALKISRAAIDRGDRERRVTADNILFEERTIGGRIEFLLVLERQAGRYKTSPLNLHGCLVQLQQKLDFVIGRHVKWVFLEGAPPISHGLRRL